MLSAPPLHHVARVLGALGCGLARAVPIRADDWPGWRGPGLDGNATPVCVDGWIILRTHDSLSCIGEQ